jgi:hypothetical protein
VDVLAYPTIMSKTPKNVIRVKDIVICLPCQ